MPDFSSFDVNQCLEALVGKVPHEYSLSNILLIKLNLTKEEKQQDIYTADNIDDAFERCSNEKNMHTKACIFI